MVSGSPAVEGCLIEWVDPADWEPSFSARGLGDDLANEGLSKMPGGWDEWIEAADAAQSVEITAQVPRHIHKRAFEVLRFIPRGGEMGGERGQLGEMGGGLGNKDGESAHRRLWARDSSCSLSWSPWALRCAVRLRVKWSPPSAACWGRPPALNSKPTRSRPSATWPRRGAKAKKAKAKARPLKARPVKARPPWRMPWSWAG